MADFDNAPPASRPAAAVAFDNELPRSKTVASATQDNAPPAGKVVASVTLDNTLPQVKAVASVTFDNAPSAGKVIASVTFENGVPQPTAESRVFYPLLVDNFDRADDTPLDARWKVGVYPGVTDTHILPVCKNNQGYCSPEFAWRSAILNSPAFANGYIQARFHTAGGLHIRRSSDGMRALVIYVGTNNSLQLYRHYPSKLVKSFSATDPNYALTGGYGAGKLLRVEAEGDIIRVFYNGIAMLPFRTDILEPGEWGWGFTSGQCIIDDFECGILVGASNPAPAAAIQL